MRQHAMQLTLALAGIALLTFGIRAKVPYDDGDLIKSFAHFVLDNVAAALILAAILWFLIGAILGV
jgi:hypothetical protein